MKARDKEEYLREYEQLKKKVRAMWRKIRMIIRLAPHLWRPRTNSPRKTSFVMWLIEA